MRLMAKRLFRAFRRPSAEHLALASRWPTAGRRLCWSACVGLGFAFGCGGKAETDPPSVEATGGISAVGGKAAGSSGEGAFAGSTSAGAGSGGRTASGGSAGTSGGSGPSTGGTSDSGPPTGPEVWFPRGQIELRGRPLADAVSFLLSTPRFEQDLEASMTHSGAPCGDNALAEKQLDAQLALVSDAALLDGLGCTSADDECARDVSERFASRAWRRPLSAAESDDLYALYSSGVSAGGETAALRSLVREVLSAPPVRCLSEQGKLVASGRYELDDYELASLLSYGVTGLPPDEELWTALEAGELDLSEQLERLLDTAAARSYLELKVQRFFRVPEAGELWIGVEGTPDADPALAASMVEETRRFIDDIVFERSAPVSELLTADYSFIDGALAEHYGLSSPTSDEFEQVDLSGTRRRGVLHHASWLTATSHPGATSLSARSAYPLKLLCAELPPSPPNVAPPSPVPFEGSTRERIEVATSASVCRACHSVLNPIFYAFEHFDSVGAYREEENGFAIDSSGSLSTFDGAAFEFDDSAELVEQIGRHPAFNDCFVRTAVSEFVALSTSDSAVSDYVARAHRPGDDEEVLEVIRDFVASDHFRFRGD